MSGVTYPLIAEGAHSSGTLLGLAADDGSGFGTGEFENWLPPVETRWARMFRRVCYVISVLGTSGTAPTSWSLGARFEQHLAHTQGYQYQFPVWAPIQAEQLEQCILEGVGWYGPGQAPPADPAVFGVIASNTTAADDGSGTLPNGLTVPVAGTTSATLITKRTTVSRTVVDQLAGMRVRLQPTITGGDSTTRIICSAQALGTR